MTTKATRNRRVKVFCRPAPPSDPLSVVLAEYCAEYGSFTELCQAYRDACGDLQLHDQRREKGYRFRIRFYGDPHQKKPRVARLDTLKARVRKAREARDAQRERLWKILRRARDLSLERGGVYVHLADRLDRHAGAIGGRHTPLDSPAMPAVERLEALRIRRFDRKTGKTISEGPLTPEAKAALSRPAQSGYDPVAWDQHFRFIREVRRVLDNLGGAELALADVLEQHPSEFAVKVPQGAAVHDGGEADKPRAVVEGEAQRVAGGKPAIGGGKWTTEEVLEKAVAAVKQHGWHGHNNLARAIECPKSTLSKAVKASAYLKARAAEHKAEKTGGSREVQMSQAILDKAAEQQIKRLAAESKKEEQREERQRQRQRHGHVNGHTAA